MKCCPFCGSKSVGIVLVRFKWERNEHFSGKCRRCSTYGPGIAKLYHKDGSVPERKEAEDAWNKRTYEVRP